VADAAAGHGHLYPAVFTAWPSGKVLPSTLREFRRHIEETAAKERAVDVVGWSARPTTCGFPPESDRLAFICDVYHHFEFPSHDALDLGLEAGGSVILIDFTAFPA